MSFPFYTLLRPWWRHSRLDTLRPGQGPSQLPLYQGVVPVRVLGHDRDDVEESLYGADASVAWPVGPARFVAARLRSLTSTTWLRVEQVRAWSIDQATRVRSPIVNFILATGPRGGWSFAVGPTTTQSGLFGGVPGQPTDALVEIGLSDTSPSGELVGSPPDSIDLLPAPVLVSPSTELLCFSSSQNPTGAAQFGLVAFYWRELRA